jgi:hypothetical protein
LVLEVDDSFAVELVLLPVFSPAAFDPYIEPEVVFDVALDVLSVVLGLPVLVELPRVAWLQPVSANAPAAMQVMIPHFNCCFMVSFRSRFGSEPGDLRPPPHAHCHVQPRGSAANANGNFSPAFR